jgi:hypothetical protein
MEGSQTEAEFLDIIQTKALRVFLLAIHSHLSTALPRDILFLQTHATSYDFHSSVNVHCKKKGGKPDGKPYPLSLWFKKSIQKP